MEAKHIKDVMEAYASVYGQSENQQVLSEEGVETQTHIPPMKSSGSTGGKPQSQLPKRTPANAKNVEYYKDDVDLFDLVKGHLMSEGYADTEEAALAIMANMSEEWKQSIIEQDARFTVTALDKKLNTPAYQRLQQGNPAYKAGGTGANKLPPA